MKIYTKSGDKGKTSLASGRRLDKHDILIEAYGTVDELNAFVGELRDLNQFKLVEDQLAHIQYTLFNVGAELARDGVVNDKYPDVSDRDIIKLEHWIDELTEPLAPMTAFILPAGSAAITKAHVCRTVCRRAERRVLQVAQDVESRDEILIYLNRLSDYFFTLARYFAFKQDVTEVLWNVK